MTPPRRNGPRGPVIDKTILGPYLYRARHAAGLTQAEVAAAAGLDVSVYNAYEKSRRGMETEKVPRLAAALNVNPEVMLALAEERGVVAELAVQVAELRQRVASLERNAGA